MKTSIARGAGVPGEQVEELGEVRGAAEGGLDVARVAQEVLGGRPGVEDDHRLAAGEVLELGRLAGGALDGGVGAVDIDEDVAAAARREGGVDLGEEGAGSARRASPWGRVAASAMRSRWMNGRSEVPAPVVHSRSWSRVVGLVADPERRGAEMQPAVGGDGVEAVVLRADRQAVGRVEERDAAVVDELGAGAEDGVAALAEDQRRRHQPHRRVVEDEEGGDGGGEQQDEEEDPAEHAAAGRRRRSLGGADAERVHVWTRRYAVDKER